MIVHEGLRSTEALTTNVLCYGDGEGNANILK